MNMAETVGRKLTIADDFRDAIYVGPNATGSLLLSRQNCQICRTFETDPTSDPVRNKVDAYWLSINPLEVYVVTSSMHHLIPVEVLATPDSFESSIVFARGSLDLLSRPVSDVIEPDFHEQEIDAPAAPEQLPEVMAQLRRQLALSIGDLAHMLGLSRRHFYNLASGANASRETETRVRTIAEMTTRLDAELSDAELIRAAILTPVGTPSLTFYEVAEQGDLDALRTVLDALIQKIHGRGIRRVRRAVPRRATTPQRDKRKRHAREALKDIPQRAPVSRGDPGGAN